MDLADLVPARRAMNRLLRLPLLHFLALGALLYAAESRWPARQEIIRAVDARQADEEILYREALRSRLDQTDPVVRSRLIQNLRYAEPELAGDDAARLARARALGMDRKDLVVRRRLIEAMRNRIESGVAPSEAQLREYFARHAPEYAGPPRYVFRQLFFTDAGAARLAQQRLARGVGSPPIGEAFALGNSFNWSEPQIARAFGPGFARALALLPQQEWSDPLRSPYGWHLVRVVSATPARAADFAEVRGRLYYALLEEQRTQALERALTSLRRRYPVQIVPQLALGAAR